MKLARMTSATSVAAMVVMLVTAIDAAAVEVGVGLSELKDAKAAGAEAATKAKAALGEKQAKAVLVFNGGEFGKQPQMDDMLAAVGKVFDCSIIYGCGGYAPLTHQGNAGTVGVLALGGAIEVTTASAPVKDNGHEACGKQIGKALKASGKTGAGGRILLLFGDCHVPADDALVKGVCSVLGEKFPVVGGSASSNPRGIYEKGKFVPKSNLGVLLTGNFTCGLSTKKDMTPQGLIDSARNAFKEAIAENQKKTAVVFVFDCGGRRGAMLKNKNFPEELKAMKGVSGDTPIFGFYGSGEIGHANNDAPSCGVGYSISTCAVIVK